jgi:hypothetical protein
MSGEIIVLEPFSVLLEVLDLLATGCQVVVPRYELRQAGLSRWAGTGGGSVAGRRQAGPFGAARR